MDLLTIIAIVAVAVVVYHWQTEDNFYKGLLKSKDTLRYTGVVAKNTAVTTKKGWRASKATYQAELSETEVEFKKAGKSYEEDRRSRDKAAINSINSVFEGTNTSLDNAYTEAETRRKAAEKELAALYA